MTDTTPLSAPITSGVCDDLATYAHKLQVALTGIAGGGSENFVRHRDGFRADIDFCRRSIQRRFDANMEAVKMWARQAKAAEAERDALRAEVERLKEALHPFARYADAALVDGFDGEIGEVYKDGLRVSIRTTDLRRARAALRSSQHTVDYNEGEKTDG